MSPWKDPEDRSAINASLKQDIAHIQAKRKGRTMKLPSKPFLIASQKRWKRAHNHRQERLVYWHKEFQKAETSRARDRATAAINKWERLRDEASQKLVDRRNKLKRYDDDKPRIITAKQAGIWQSNVFGWLGEEFRVTTHYAASPRARNLREGIKMAIQFAFFHKSKGWGSISYAYLIPDTGEIICGRSTSHKAAHVANMNAGNIGINFFCTAGHEPTEAQKKSARWLIANAHTKAMPKLHRTDRDLRKADIRGHNAWPGQSTGCPGNFTPRKLGV